MSSGGVVAVAVRVTVELCPLVRDEAVEPGQVGGDGRGVALEERAQIGVDPTVGQCAGGTPLVAPPDELGAAPLEQLDALGRLQQPAEGDAERERPVVRHVGIDEELVEALAAGVRDAVHLPAPRTACSSPTPYRGAGGAALGSERGELAGERAT